MIQQQIFSPHFVCLCVFFCGNLFDIFPKRMSFYHPDDVYQFFEWYIFVYTTKPHL